MTSEEADQEREVENLLLVVDVANIRPRTFAHRQKFLGRVTSRFRKAPADEKRTTMGYIDECLASLSEAAPGAVVVKFADFALADYLPDEDLPELDRRSKLGTYDIDKIFIIETAQADVPLLAAVNRVGGSIVSNDNFQARELKEWVTPQTRVIKQVYSEETGKFSFTIPGGEDLRQWWMDINGFVNHELLESDEYLDIEGRLRTRVKDATFEWINESLTFVPEVPKDINRVLERPVEVEPFAKDFSEPEDVFAEELERLKTLVGKRVTLTGRLVVIRELYGMVWSYRTTPIVLANPPEFVRHDWRHFVRITGTLTERDGFLTLKIPDGATYESFNFETLSRAYLRIPESIVDPVLVNSQARWTFPSFTNSLVRLKSAKARRDTKPEDIGIRVSEPVDKSSTVNALSQEPVDKKKTEIRNSDEGLTKRDHEKIATSTLSDERKSAEHLKTEGVHIDVDDSPALMGTEPKTDAEPSIFVGDTSVDVVDGEQEDRLPPVAREPEVKKTRGAGLAIAAALIAAISTVLVWIMN